jgi:hypothetical protein
MGIREANIEDYFKGKIFLKLALLNILKRINRNPIAKKVVLNVGLKLKVSTPCPNMLYGYNSLKGFP